MKSNRTMKVKINKKHPRQSLKICRGYLFVFCGSIFIIRRSVCLVISPIRTSALPLPFFLRKNYFIRAFLYLKEKTRQKKQKNLQFYRFVSSDKR